MNYKKIISILFAAAISVSMTFAIDLSVGGGFGYSYNVLSKKITIGDQFQKISVKHHEADINAFFDAQYAMLKLGVNFLVGDPTITLNNNVKSEDIKSEKVSSTYIDFALLGKYPFDLGFAKLYPILGFDFKINVSTKDDGKDIREILTSEQKNALNSYYFVAGLGSDIFVMEKLFIRPIALFGIRMNSTKDNPWVNGGNSGMPSNAKVSNFNYMINAGISVGYKLN